MKKVLASLSIGFLVGASVTAIGMTQFGNLGQAPVERTNEGRTNADRMDDIVKACEDRGGISAAHSHTASVSCAFDNNDSSSLVGYLSDATVNMEGATFEGTEISEVAEYGGGPGPGSYGDTVVTVKILP